LTVRAEACLISTIQVNEGPGEIQKPRTGRNIRAGLLLLFLVAGIGGLLWWTMIPREPSYQGKPLSFWLTTAIEHGGAFSDPKDPKAIECREAVCSIGTNAIPVLLRILRAKDTVLKKVVMDLLDKQNYINIPIESVEEQIPKAGVGFHLLGELATNALPALVDVCQHPPSPSAKDVAETVLLQLYPAKSVAIPYWVPAEKRARWYIAAGRDQAQSGTQSNALLAFSQAIELEPTNVYAYLDRGDTRLQLQDLTGARMDFEKVMELSPSNGAAIFGRGLCRFGLKDFKGAETDFTKAINVDSNEFALRVFNARGLARANLRNLDDALSDFNKAIEINPYGASFYRDRAAVETGQTEYERALADASKSVELDKEDAMAWALRGRIQCALKNYRDAVEDADKAIQLSPKESIAYTGRATARMCMNEFDSSAADLEKALQLNPKNPSAFVIRGVLRAKHGGQDDAALADLEHAVELAPTEPGPYGTLGLFQYKVSKWEPALANCRKALEMGAIASVSSYHSYIWLIRAQSGEEEAANKELEAYLNSLDRTKTNEWSATTARFFSGSLPESNFLSLATTAAKRPSAITNQISDSLFYAAMKRKLAGDKVGAVELLQKCLDTRDENNIAYMNAGVELRALKAQ
jgi:tetratricopeptide (TPR) repeat protein